MALKEEANSMVKSYPLEADVAENWRRNAEAKRKHGLRSRMLEEAEESAKKNAAVAMHWADLFAIDVPQVPTRHWHCFHAAAATDTTPMATLCL